MAQQLTSNDSKTKQKKSKKKATKRLSLEGQLKAARISLERYVNPSIIQKEKLIPKRILKNAKGIVFLSIIKAGFVFAANVGTGCVIVRNQGFGQNRTITGWTPPSSIGVAGLSFGFLAGGAKIDYLFILNNDYAVNQFTGKGQLRLGGELGLSLGPIGRDADVTVGVGDGGVSAIYSYSHSEGLYGGLELKGKVISVRPKCNEQFYNVKNVKCKDILEGNVRMPRNDEYDRIIHLLNSYCLDHAYPVHATQRVDMEAMLKLNDINIERAVNTLKSMFVDVDKDVIKMVLMEQCWGDMHQATDILLRMSKKQVTKSNANQKIDELDVDTVTKGVEQKEIEEVANMVKEDVIKQAELRKEEKIVVYTPLSGRCVTTTQKTTVSEKDMQYRIKVGIGDKRVCELLVLKRLEPVKYVLESVVFEEHDEEEKKENDVQVQVKDVSDDRIEIEEQDKMEQHDKSEKQDEEEEKQPMISTFSSIKLKALARSNTVQHIELSDDDDDYEEEEEEDDEEHYQHIKIKGDDDDDDDDDDGDDYGKKEQQTKQTVPSTLKKTSSLAALDNLLSSFDNKK